MTSYGIAPGMNANDRSYIPAQIPQGHPHMQIPPPGLPIPGPIPTGMVPQHIIPPGGPNSRMNLPTYPTPNIQQG